MNVLLINLTRFGDLIQTQPVISGLRERGHRIGLACLENFVSATTLLDGVEEVFAFSGARLLSGLDTDWRLAVRDISGYRQHIFDTFLPDMTINLTPSIASRILAFALTPDNGTTVGFSVDELGFNADTSSWAAFLQMAGINRGASPFNICDLFRRAAGLDREGNSLNLVMPDAAAMAQADALLLPGTEKGKGFLALQMGASEDRRRWPVEYFAAVARMFYDRNGLVPVLLGTKSETPLGDQFASSIDFPHVNCIGRTSLSELAGVLVRCKMLLTNDTGTLHLAAGLGVPSCSVFLATAQPWDTGPYRSGNICLEPDMECHPCEFGKSCPRDEVCRTAVTPEAMYAYAAPLVGEDETAPVSGTRAWRTRSGEDGFMELVSLSNHDAADRTVWIRLQRMYFSAFLDGRTYSGTVGLGKCIRPAMRADISKTLTSARDMLFLLSQQGMLLLKNPRPQAKAKFLASWQRLQTIFASNKSLNIIGLLWMFETQKQGDDFDSLLALAQRYLALTVSLLEELA